MPPRKIEPAEAAALRDQGWTYQQIGDRYGVSANSARLAVVKHQQEHKREAKVARRGGKAQKVASPSEDRTRFQITFSRQDRERIDELRMHCGIMRAADIIRLAVNTLASDIRKGRAPKELPEPPQESLLQQTTLRIDQSERRAISLIQDHYQLRSAAETIRLSLIRLFQLLM